MTMTTTIPTNNNNNNSSNNDDNTVESNQASWYLISSYVYGVLYVISEYGFKILIIDRM